VALFFTNERPNFIALDVSQAEVRQRIVKEVAALIPEPSAA
jgi:hypothetical protein